MKNTERQTVIEKYPGTWATHYPVGDGINTMPVTIIKNGSTIGSFYTYNMVACCGAAVISGGNSISYEPAVLEEVFDFMNAVMVRHHYLSLFATAVEGTTFDLILKAKLKPVTSAMNVRSRNMVNSYAWGPTYAS